MALISFHPPLEGGSESEAIRGGVRDSAPELSNAPSPKNSAHPLRSLLEFYRPSLKGRVE